MRRLRLNRYFIPFPARLGRPPADLQTSLPIAVEPELHSFRRRLALRLLLVALLLMPALPSSASQRLVTESFDITIEVRCQEGVVGCDKVHYTGVHRKTGRSIKLVGQERHTRCADGVTPCRFLGYVFKNGDVSYAVLDDGTLSVKRGERVLVQERGAWQ